MLKADEIQRLKFRRQYILSPVPVNCPFQYNKYEISEKYILYAHIDLQVTIAQSNEKKLYLLGDILDYTDPTKTNADLLKDLSGCDFDTFLNKMGAFSGRYVVIYVDGEDMRVIHDAFASRRVYYGNISGKVYFTSQPYLLATILGLPKSANSEITEYFNTELFRNKDNASIGDFTAYDDLKQLLPNHFYDVQSLSAIRYWPAGKVQDESLENKVKTVANMLAGYLLSAKNRYDLMIPVTAGKDSRALLAATRGFSDETFLYVNKRKGDSTKNPDVDVPSKMLRELGLEFHVLESPEKVDEDFKSIYHDNNEYASEKYLPIIYNYYLNFEDKVNIPGITASGGIGWFRNIHYPVSSRSLAIRTGMEKYKFAVDYYHQWIENAKKVCQENNVRILDLFYIEERIANWASQIQLDKDIAQEEIKIFCSRDLINIFLSAPTKYLRYPSYRFHLQMIRELWPDLLNYPINPQLKRNMISLLQNLGLLDVIYRFRDAKYK